MASHRSEHRRIGSSSLLYAHCSPLYCKRQQVSDLGYCTMLRVQRHSLASQVPNCRILIARSPPYLTLPAARRRLVTMASAGAAALPEAWCWHASSRCSSWIAEVEGGQQSPGGAIPITPVVQRNGAADAAIAGLSSFARRWVQVGWALGAAAGPLSSRIQTALTGYTL